MESEPEFRAQVARFVPLEVDIEKPEGKRLAEKYEVSPIPDVVFVTPEGKQVERFLGAVDLKEFKEHADKATASK